MRRSARPLWASVAALVVAASVIVLPSSATAVTGDPSIATTPAGVTSVAPTQGKAQGSGLWGYVGDITTRSISSTFTYGLSFSPIDGSLWMTDSAKITYTSNSLFCAFAGGTVMGSICYVGDSRVMHYDLNTADWAAGQYMSDGAYAVPAAGVNDGIGANFDALADAQVLDGSTLPNGQFVGARGVAVTEEGVAWVLDSDHYGTAINPTGKPVRLLNPDGTEGASFGQALSATAGWANRNAPDVLGYTVGITRLENGNMLATSQVPELLKEYTSDGTFVRNIFLNQATGTAYPSDAGFRSPYAVTADPTTAANDVLFGYIDPGSGRGSFIERIDLDACTTEAVGNPRVARATAVRCCSDLALEP